MAAVVVAAIGITLAFIFAALAALFAFQSFRATASFAPWILSSMKTARAALRQVNTQSHRRFIDLGCGNGKIVALAAREFQLQAEGYERAVIPFALARLRQRFSRTPVTIRRKDLYTAPLGEFDVIYIYGLPENVNGPLADKLRREVKPGTIIISNYSSLRDKEPLHTITDRWRRVYVYSW